MANFELLPLVEDEKCSHSLSVDDTVIGPISPEVYAYFMKLLQKLVKDNQ